MNELIEAYNKERLHSAVGNITPIDKLKGEAEEICKARDAKLEATRATRKMELEAQIAHASMENNRWVPRLAADS